MSKQLSDIMSRVPAATPRPAKPLEPAPVLTVVTSPAAEPGLPAEALRPTAKPKRGEGAGTPTKPVKVTRVAAGEPEQALQANVPVSIRKAVIRRAAEDDTTVRSLILQGLKAIGFDISDDQIRDRRR
jgi:hypothetical protein